jgi:hypothetical protein
LTARRRRTRVRLPPPGDYDNKGPAAWSIAAGVQRAELFAIFLRSVFNALDCAIFDYAQGCPAIMRTEQLHSSEDLHPS